MSASGSVVTTFTWDAATGRRIKEGPLADPGEVTYADDAAGRLARYTDASTQTEATYTYDAAGQRTSSVVGQGSVTTTSTYTYEGLTLLSLDAESTEGTAAASWRIDYLADASGRPYGGIYTSGETSAVAFGIVTTDRGDVRELTDGEGIPFARYDHDAYGNPTRTLSAATAGLDAATAESIAGRNILRYAGYAFDEHSGLYYLSQRYYDPATCQFITKDPAKADGEESAYQYCGGDPVGKVDSSGEFALAATAGIVIPVWVVAAVVTAVVLLALPPDVKAELSRQMDAQIRSVTRSLKQRFPKDRYTWKWSTHKPHVSAATIKANLPKGSAARKAAWLVAHHRYRHHAHVDIYRNGVKVYRANI
ncbi:MAG: RHS repeat-associated core domain-containing protein [Actinomycetota bacterium]